MITLAREARGLSQGQLAERIGASQGHLSKVEAGLLPASAGMHANLVEVLDYTPEFFCWSDPVFGPSTCEFYHRKRQSLSNKLLRTLHARMNVQRIQIGKLLASVEIGTVRVPKIQPEEADGSPSEVARLIRASWQLPAGPVKSLTEAIENAGGIVVRSDFGTQQLDAVSRWVPGMPPLFFVNRQAPGDRQRLTLAHELGHIVMHQVPNPDMEQEAFEFAAELLMPESDIKQYFAGLTIPKLAALKAVWMVSMAAIARRAKELGSITERQYRSLVMRLNRLGFRTNEPPELNVAPEDPSLLSEMFELYRRDLDYSQSELASLLGVREDELRLTYGLAPAHDDHRTQLRLLGGARSGSI